MHSCTHAFVVRALPRAINSPSCPNQERFSAPYLRALRAPLRMEAALGSRLGAGALLFGAMQAHLSVSLQINDPSLTSALPARSALYQPECRYRQKW